MQEDFRDDFKDFIADTFNALSTRNIRDIKIVLLTRGVFIRYKGYVASKAITDSLAEVVADKEEHQWSNEEIKDIKRQYSLILLYRINKKIASD